MGLLSRIFGAGTSSDQIDIADTLAALDNPSVQIVDCRLPQEWTSGHVVGAILMPLGTIGKRLNELDPSRPVIVVCRSGHRSAIAARQLSAAGFGDVKSMRGGMNAWGRAGHPLIS